MPQVRVACPLCGPVDVDRDSMSAHVLLATMACSYRFACPRCAAEVYRACPPSAVDALVGCGVTLVVTPHDTPTGSGAPPPLTEADVVRFAQLLADDVALAAAVRGISSSR
jgi:hypothetical protein